MDNFIVIDTHECKLKDHFSSHEHIKFQLLEVGDIILYKESKPVLVIERKTLADLYSSIKDGRWKEQKCRLTNYFPKEQIIYLIEDKHINLKCINMKIIYGAIINTLLRDNIKIMFSKSLDHTVLLINILLDRLINKSEFFDNSIKNIEYSDTVKLKKKDNLNPQLCQQIQLAQIPGVSIKMAAIILEKYGTIKKLVSEESIDPNIQITPKRKLGKVLAERIKEYLLI